MADLNVNSIGDASGGTTTTVNGFTPTASNMAGRNRIINGNFDIWQRGTSFTSLTSAEFTADRWNLEASGATIDVSRQEFTLGQTDVPENPKYFLRYAVTTGNDNSRIVQKIEGVSTFAGQTVTLSYWARHSSGILPTGLQARLRHEFGSGGTPSSTVYVAGSNINLTSSWQKFTQVFTVPSVSGKTLGTAGNDYLGVNLMWQIGSETSAYTIDIAQVQLEAGSVATPFCPAGGGSYGAELALCQRYCFAWRTDSLGYTQYGRFPPAFVASTTSCNTDIFLPQPMRSTAYSLTYNNKAFEEYYQTGAGATGSTITLNTDANGTSWVNVTFTLSGSALNTSQGLVCGIRYTNATDAALIISTEL